ncbi:MAG: PAS domain S-box protein [Terracidiphilus sp.]
MSRARNEIGMELLPAAVDPSSLIAEHPWSLISAIVDSCQDAIIGKDLDGIITSWNPAATRIFGYRPEEMVGRSILTLIPAELRDEEPEILRKIRAGERIESYETVRVTKTGERVFLSLTISPIRDPTGRVIGASKIAHDISERRRAEETRSRLAAIVESSDDAIVSLNLDGMVTSWNEAAHRIFGYTAEEMIGQSCRRMIPTELYSEEDDILRKMRAGDGIDHFETRRLAKDGSGVDISLSIFPLRDASGRVIGTSEIGRDISSRKKLEKFLLQSEKIAATGRMAATIAHEINNPLEAVLNLVYLARQSCPEDSDTHRYLQTAENEVERVSQIARTTLGYYRDRGTPTEVVLHELVEAALLIYESKLLGRRIRIDRAFEDSRPILVSKGEMMQVFSNVIANAIDAMPRGGAIRIDAAEKVGPTGRGVQVVIQDQGTGIEEKNLSRIFEPFFTTKPDVGTGIGLWVSKQLIENRSGRIQVTSSTAPGASGTRVAIDIPF